MRWLALLAIPLLLGADWYPIKLISDSAAREATLPARPVACYTMTATGRCGAEPPSESAQSNAVCKPAGDVHLRWQAPTACADSTVALVGIDLWTIYTDTLAPQPRPAPPTLVRVDAVEPERPVTDYVVDTFTDSNGVDIDAHTPDTDVEAGGWSHYKIVGAPTTETSATSDANAVEIQSNALEIDVSQHLSHIDVGQTDYVLEFDWVIGASSGHRLKIPIRWVDASNLYWWNLREPNDDIAFYQVVAGVQSTIGAAATAETFNTSTTYRIKIVVSGTSTELFIDGVSKGSRTMTTHAGGTHIGLGSAGITQPIRFDNLRIWNGNELLVVADGAHGHAAEAPALTQASVLSAADALHSQTTDSVTLTQALTAAVDDALHGHVSDSLALTQANVLSVADASQAHAADNLTLSQSISLALQDALHAHGVDAVVLTQAHQLAVGEATHSQTAGAPALTQAGLLASDSSSHGQTADAVTLGTAGVLAVADALHAQTVDALAVTQAHVLVANAAHHDHVADAVALTQSIILSPVDASHAQSAESIGLTQSALLGIQSAVHEHLADQPTLAEGAVLVVSDALHAHLVDSLVLPGTTFLSSRVVVVQGFDRMMVVVPTDRLMVVDAPDRMMVVIH